MARELDNIDGRQATLVEGSTGWGLIQFGGVLITTCSRVFTSLGSLLIFSSCACVWRIPTKVSEFSDNYGGFDKIKFFRSHANVSFLSCVYPDGREHDVSFNHDWVPALIIE